MKNVILLLVFYLSAMCAYAQPITGPSSVCIGSTITLANSSPGGTFTHTDLFTTLGATTGLVTGISAGIATITYNFAGGGFVVKFVSVNPVPPPITGTLTVCTGQTTTLSDAAAGGTWSSSSPPCCTVNPLTGVVTGISAPCTAVITYTLPGGCFTTATVTVNPGPAPITGSTTVCGGSTITLSDGTPGGSWSSSIPACATISSTGIVTGGSAPCVATITYTLPNGCFTTTTISVNPVPTANPVSNQVLCSGSTTSAVTFTSSTPGTTFAWTNSNPSIGLASSGTGSIAPFTAINTTSSPVVATITVTPTASGCTGAPVSFTITVNPLPDTFTVIGGGVCCPGSPGVNIRLSGSQPGIYYQLKCGTTNVGTPLPGTGFNLDFGYFCTACVYTVVATNGTTGCTRAMNGSATVTVGTTCTITGPTHVCIGSTITLAGCTGCTWTSGNPARASITSCGGVVTGIHAGLVNFTYTSGGCSSYYSVIVDSICSCTLNCNGSFEEPDTTDGSNQVTDTLVACWRSTDSLSPGVPPTIEIWRNITGVPAYLGNQFIEINSLSNSTVYTDFTGTPGTVVYISFAHRGRYTTNNQMQVHVAPFPFTTPTFSNPTPGATPLGGINTANNLGWVFHTGLTYTIPPSGQARLFFRPILGTVPAGGNLLDAVTITTTPPIVGPDTVCVGSTITETNASGCGTWTTSDGSKATVSGGVVTGVAAGSVVLTYTDCSGCQVYKRITVVASCVITGPHTVCVGATITLTGCSGCGWTSSNGTVATVGPCTGVVTGVAAGIVTITYSNGGCTSTYSVTVNPVPVPCFVTGGGSYCAGPCPDCPHIFLSCSQLGVDYFLKCGTTTVATVHGTGGTIDFGEQCTPCVYTVVGTNTTTGCSSNMIGSATVTIITPCVITGPTSVCVGSTITLTGCSGTGWSTIGGVASVTTSGVVTGLNAGIATITFTSSAGCVSTYTITVNPLPIPCILTGGGNYCVGQPCPHITLNCCQIGVTYQLYLGGVPVGAPVACTGGPIDFGVQCAAGTYTVFATNSSTGCTNTMTGSVIVSVSAAPLPITGPAVVCTGAPSTYTDGTLGGSWSTLSPCITLAPSGPSVVVTGILAPCVATITYTAGGCFVTKTITVSAPCPISGPTQVCVGSTITLIAGCTGGVWSSSNTARATVSTGGVVTGVSAGTVTICYTTPQGCVSCWTVTVLAGPVITRMGGGPFRLCQGTSICFNGGTLGNWSPYGSSIALLTSASPSVVNCVSGMNPGTQPITFTSLATGCSTTFIVTVNPRPTINSTSNRVCVGSFIYLTLTPAVSGTWTSTPNVTVDGTGKVTGLFPGTAAVTFTTIFGCSSTYTITVNANPTISLPNAVCVGSAITQCGSAGTGTWSLIPSSPFASLSSSIGTCVTVYGNAAGSVNIKYTSAATTCSVIKAIVVNPLPSAGSITVSPNPMCWGATGANIIRLGGVGTASYATSCSGTFVSGTHISTTGFSFFPRYCNVICTISTPSCGSITTFVPFKINPCFAKGSKEDGEGIETVIANPELKVYPNPNQGTFTVNLLSDKDEAAEVRITNIVGQTVNQFTSVTNNENEVKIKTAAGMYLVTVTTARGSYVAKVVVE